MVREKLPAKEKILYGCGDLAVNILLSAISFYFLYYLINVGGLRSYLASVVTIIGKVWDGISNYLMGVIVDKTHSRWGKKRVYLLFGALPVGIAFILIWIFPGGSEGARVVYYVIFYMLFNTALNVVYIPYNTLTANMTKDYDERTSINGIRIALANIGIICGAALFALLADGKESLFYPVFGTQSKAYLLTSGLFSVVACIVIFLCGYVVKERTETAPENFKSFCLTIKELFSLREFRNILLNYLLSMVGFDVIMGTFMFFINDSLGFAGGIMAMVFVAIPLVCAILSAMFWVCISERFNKTCVYAVASIYMFVILIFAMVVPKNNIATTVILVVLAGLGLSAIQIIPYASIPDVVEIDEYKYGVRREGVIYGIFQCLYKISSGIVMAIVSAILGAFGYVESTDGSVIKQPDKALMAIRVVIGVVPGIFFLCSMIFAFLGKINREKFDEIKEELMKRHGNNNENEEEENENNNNEEEDEGKSDSSEEI
ncbi:MFS transporter [Histomonas meleagridis]|uniref:MFS transporter n=1 Tax=Histomonas meleagridis TaxID=135588 RepID=UPI003559CD4F|nr:MFS transporter [Histomonas meleagridis]KAH0804973.1 MFS transporter [Histomonas meleagridis]